MAQKTCSDLFLISEEVKRIHSNGKDLLHYPFGKSLSVDFSGCVPPAQKYNFKYPVRYFDCIKYVLRPSPLNPFERMILKEKLKFHEGLLAPFP